MVLERLIFQSKRNYFIVLFAVAIGFLQLVSLHTLPLLMKQIIFTGLPIIVWLWLEKASFQALFSKLTPKGTIKMILLTLLANVLVFVVSVIYISLVGETNISANPVVETSLRLLNWVGIFIQLFGEEVLSIAIMVAIFSLCRNKLSQKTSTWVAVFVCGVIFALLHLSTYFWHVGQVLSTLVIPRVILSYIFLKAEKKPSIISSWIAHCMYDTVSIVVVMMI